MKKASLTALSSASDALQAFARGESTHVAHCLPSEVMQLEPRSVFDALYRRLGPALAKALSPSQRIDSPRQHQPDGRWLQRSSCVGINLRTTGGLLGAVKFVLTLPPHVDSVHLLPVFEPGVVGSLYGMASWRINEEFYNGTWQRLAPNLRHVNDQLLAFVNLCHTLGKTVGLDVIPHTDRFSEIALANPWLFEWVRRDDARILDHRANLHFEVERTIALYARGHSGDEFARGFFARPESEIATELFGDGDAFSRNRRRDNIIQYLYERGYETLPATMAPPYRGLRLDPSPAAVTVDEAGRRWREYTFVEPQEMSRVFGPLTRYKLYDRLEDNAAWAIDHATPRPPVWAYVAGHYADTVAHFGFDFLRGDMSHVQMRAEGVPDEPGDYYDIHEYVKAACAKTRPHTAYFAESFLTADDYMTYGSEADHLDASQADVALGNLQNHAPHDPQFGTLLAEYEALRQNREFAPCFTLFSADKDDPRFDASFNYGSAARYFFACCCPRFPSYSSLGFRQRDAHPERAANEYYTKLYVFQYDEGPKATRGPYRWGSNEKLFLEIAAIDAFRATVTDLHESFAWILAPDPSGKRKLLTWRAGGRGYAVNFGRKAATHASLSTQSPPDFGFLSAANSLPAGAYASWKLPVNP